MKRDYEKILEFWFEKSEKSAWFRPDQLFDKKIKTKFGKLLEKAKLGEMENWKGIPESSLALIILLDQFSRNIYRENPKAFESDEQALRIAKESIEKGFDKLASLERRIFFYMPFMHSENIKNQKFSVRIFRELSEKDIKFKINLDFAIKHMGIIKRFGRFPHRNKILGRKSTKEETEFLKKEGRGF
ncbi:MAG: DUF924 family protein [Candidatus Pacearchaeota archaeon]